MKKKVIHLVEPDEGDFRVLRSALEGLGYEVVAMADPEAALEAFPSLAPDLVLTAYPLPTATGEDFAYQTKRISPVTPVIGIIRRGMREVARDAITYGCDDFVTKPVDAQLLADKVRRLLASPQDLPDREDLRGIREDPTSSPEDLPAAPQDLPTAPQDRPTAPQDLPTAPQDLPTAPQDLPPIPEP